jgi:putative flippase GtrA
MKEDKVYLFIKKIFDKLKIKISKDNLNLCAQIFKFVIVGGIATIIDFIIYYICYNYIGLNPLLANIISFSISVIYNFYASVKWVFDVDNSKNKKVIFIEFIVFAVLGLLLSELLLFIFIDKCGLKKMISKILATIIVMVFNFITRKLFLEKRK